ncbi:MAG: 3-deoxy-manno-octulosonate cytidylyltransferase [Pseudomonadota bacterium]
MKAVIVIPSRYGSTRFPGKPFVKVAGVGMLNRVWRIAKAVKGVDEVYVATDDKRIFDEVEKFGGKAVMTSSECPNGTHRVLETLEKLEVSDKSWTRSDIAVNFQGDAVVTPPWVIEALISEMKKDKNILIATPAIEVRGEKTAGTMVTFDTNHNALFFSRAQIPNSKNHPDAKDIKRFRHIGIYAYTYDALRKFCSLEPTPLEKIEKLEQLRALENGIPIKVVEVDYKGRTHGSIDTPDDVKTVEDIIKKEGELV